MKKGKSPSRHPEDQRDILVSIILSESTSSLLNLNVPNIEEDGEVRDSKCIIRSIDSAQVYKQHPSILSNLLRKFNGTPETDSNSEIIMEIAYFAENFRSASSSTTDLSIENEFIDPYVRQNLKPQEVFIKPLVNAKTAAHEDKINIQNNEIIVDLIVDDCHSVNSDIICRICHGGESLGDLLSPCKCKGSIALAHIDCLERWLKESDNSYCELCKHHFKVVRQPKYGVICSIIVYLMQPGENLRDILIDLMAFICYTPSALATTYMLMLICENVARSHIYKNRPLTSHLIALCAIFGMAAIDFTYSSWLIVTFQRQAIAWKTWYRNNSYLKLILPEHKRRPFKSNHRNNLTNNTSRQNFIIEE